MGRIQRAFALGLATGIIGVLFSLVPLISSQEDSVGLGTLFWLRGPLPSPARVAIISIDESAAAHLDLPQAVRDWPRSYHARLIDRLVAEEAASIVLDLQFFKDGSAADDAALAAAIARSKRVVLVRLLERIADPPQEIWRRQDPLPALAEGAAGVAPVPIPDTTLVSWFWTFLPTNEGEVPTLPSVALQVGHDRTMRALTDALRAASLDMPAPVSGPSDRPAYMREVRRLLKGNGSVVSKALARIAGTDSIDTRESQWMRRLATLYTGSATSYLNFYGPPGSVCTVSYEVIHGGHRSPCPLKDATVFVGVGRSRQAKAEQIDTYHTIFESPDGVDFSGVELQATAFANLADGTALRPPNPAGSLVMLLGVGFVFGGSAYWIRTRRRYVRGRASARFEAAGVAVLLAAVYCLITYLLFARFRVIVPVVIPVAVQLPAAVILGLVIRPVVHVERLTAVCMAADAGGSTAMGQRLPHTDYAQLMIEYNRVLVDCVTAHRGLVLPPEGDGFVSFWILRQATPDGDASARLAACQAALGMGAAADGFNQAHAERDRLPLRIGLTVGEVTIRSDADRGAFAAVGDAVNVAARLQVLNRTLGTRVLASEAVVAALDDRLNLKPILEQIELRGVSVPPRVFAVSPGDPAIRV